MVEFSQASDCRRQGRQRFLSRRLNSRVEFCWRLVFFSRIAGLGLAIDMSVAFWTADREAPLSFFSDLSKFYNADPFILWQC